jgi:hypothetical protein
MNPIRYFAGLHGWGIGPSQSLYLHKTTERNAEDIQALTGTRTLDPSV